MIKTGNAQQISSDLYSYKESNASFRYMGLVTVGKDFRSGNAGLWSFLYFENQKSLSYVESTAGFFKRWNLSNTLIECGIGVGVKNTPKFIQTSGYFYSETRKNLKKEKGKLTCLLYVEQGMLDKDFWYRITSLYNVTEKLSLGIYSEYNLLTGLEVEFSLKKFKVFGASGYNIQTKQVGALLGLHYDM